MMKRRNFCELGAWAYSISTFKQIVFRHLRNAFSREKMATKRQESLLPVLVYSCQNNMIKHGRGIDLQLQLNKADNIRLACSRMDGLVIYPDESFSFWYYVGKTSKKNGFADGRVLINGSLVTGVGGGLCNLANSLNLLVMHSPLTITERHHHSDALAPDANGIRTPYSAGVSVNYNYVDYRFSNTTNQPVQISAMCEGNELYLALYTTQEFPYTYRIIEEGHHFTKEADGNYYRVSRIYRETLERDSEQVVAKELQWDNHSKVMFDPQLLPNDAIEYLP